MNFAALSNCKDEKNRSAKLCCCGGHNASNPKSNKQHHSTKIKLLRKGRKKK